MWYVVLLWTIMKKQKENDYKFFKYYLVWMSLIITL